MMLGSSWIRFVTLGMVGTMGTMGTLGIAGAVLVSMESRAGAAPPAVSKKVEAPAKDTPVKPDPAIKPAIDKRLGPFRWGMTSDKVIAILEGQIDDVYAKKIASAYNPKQQTLLEVERDKKKKDIRTHLVSFEGGGGVSGYEMKAPGEFTYHNHESALEVARPGGGERQLFFVNDRLWKVYDHVPLGAKDSALGDSFDAATDKLATELGKGKNVSAKSSSPSYYGTIIQVPQHVLWSDGTTQVRLADHTKREDTPDRTVGLAFEELATVERLPTLRFKVEVKASDPWVDKAGYTPPKPPEKKGDKKKGKP